MGKLKAKTTKKDQVKAYLIKRGKITSMQAIKKFGATRLSGIIFVLREEGMKIKTKLKTKKDRNGNSCTFAIYKYKN